MFAALRPAAVGMAIQPGHDDGIDAMSRGRLPDQIGRRVTDAESSRPTAESGDSWRSHHLRLFGEEGRF
jgi:hypothetical protein